MGVKKTIADLLHDVCATGRWNYGVDMKTGEHGGHDMTPEDIAEYLVENSVTVQEGAEWLEIEDDWNMETIYQCSACKEEFVTIDGTPAENLWNYCPHCGAKMTPQPKKGE